jgi:hypothetical protein
MHTNTRPDMPAIRDDHGPFDQAAILLPALTRSAPFALLIFLRWTSYSCSHCHSMFRRDFWPQNVRLGCGSTICTKCGQPFDDGSREWPQLTWGKKLRYFLPPGIQALAGGGLFCIIFTFFIAPGNAIDWQFMVFLPLFFLSPVLIWSPGRFLFVLRSTRRFHEAAVSPMSSNAQI